MNNKTLKRPVITVGMGSCGIAAGAQNVYEYFQKAIQEKNLDILVESTGCFGMCYQEPLVEIKMPDGDVFLYKQVTDKKDAPKILEDHILNNKPVENILVNLDEEQESGVLAGQTRITLRNCGVISPESIEEYLEVDGYQGIKKALETMTPEQVIEEMLASGLRGRGGAGFPTGLKWKFGREASGDKKYMICNADEGDPGAFMDRGILESDPHSVIEGMLIAAYAIGAENGYFYVRAEYPLAIKRLNNAIAQAKEKNILGKNIFGTDFNFEVKIKEGAGAFVCGEETALIHSIEGERGMPRKRPPFPAQSGLWDYPTIINNVETLASIPWILSKGAKEYAKYGTGKSKGTKVFALAGDIKRGGLIEVEMGTKLKDIVYKIGGGIEGDKKLKALQIGGPSGGCLPVDLIDTPVDYETLAKTGAIIGSGGLVVMDETACMIDVAKFFLNFTQSESCGKCTFCRIGSKRMLEILTRISEGNGKEEDIDLLEELAEKVSSTSLCGLGQTAPNPILTTLKYFRGEYFAHIHNKKCRAGKCQAIITYSINEKCIGCTACVRVCAVNAISGERKKPHEIDIEKCIKCGNCIDACKFDAIRVE